MKIYKIISNTLYALVMAAIILVVVGVVLEKRNNPWGIRVFHVLSGSMTPALPVGGVVIDQRADKYEAGEIITYRFGRGGSVVTHRVVGVEEDADINKLMYVTKGDANEEKDPEPVAHTQVLGKVVFSLPYLGYVMGFAKTQTGFILLVVVPATILIYSELVNIKNELARMIRNRSKKGKESKIGKTGIKQASIKKNSHSGDSSEARDDRIPSEKESGENLEILNPSSAKSSGRARQVQNDGDESSHPGHSSDSMKDPGSRDKSKTTKKNGVDAKKQPDSIASQTTLQNDDVGKQVETRQAQPKAGRSVSIDNASKKKTSAKSSKNTAKPTKKKTTRKKKVDK